MFSLDIFLLSLNLTGIIHSPTFVRSNERVFCILNLVVDLYLLLIGERKNEWSVRGGGTMGGIVSKHLYYTHSDINSYLLKEESFAP